MIQLFADSSDDDSMTGAFLIFGIMTYQFSDKVSNISGITETLFGLFNRMDYSQQDIYNLALVLVANTCHICFSREDDNNFHKEFRNSEIYQHLVITLRDYDVSDQSRHTWYKVVIVTLCHNWQYVDLIINWADNQWHALNLVHLFQDAGAAGWDNNNIMDALCCLWNNCKHDDSKSTILLCCDILLPINEQLQRLCSNRKPSNRLPIGFHLYTEMYREAHNDVQSSILTCHNMLLTKAQKNGWTGQFDW
jgi:hypothetical protein